MNKKITDILNINLDSLENKILNNLFLVLFLIFWWIIILYLTPIIIDAQIFEWWILKDFRLLDLKFTITSLWTIFAFWYWYKKYERDKELELLENTITSPPKIEDISVLIFNWSIWYGLYKKNYIKKGLWLDLEIQYLRNFYILLEKCDWEIQITTAILNLIIPIENRGYFKTIPEKLKIYYTHQVNFPTELYPSWVYEKYNLILKEIEDIEKVVKEFN